MCRESVKHVAFLKVCANGGYYTHSSPPCPFTHKHFPPLPLFFLSSSLSLRFSSSVISGVLNSANSGQECPDTLVKMTSNSPRRQQTGLTSSVLPVHIQRTMMNGGREKTSGRQKAKENVCLLLEDSIAYIVRSQF